MTKRIVVNYVGIHSTMYAKKIIEGLAYNDCEILAIVSKHMEDIVEEWGKNKNIILVTVDGYTTKLNFGLRLLKLLLVDIWKIKHIVKEFNPDVFFIPGMTYWTIFIDFVIRKVDLIYVMHDPMPHEGRVVPKYINNLIGYRSDKIVLLSEQFATYVKNKFHKIVNVIPSGCEVVKEKKCLVNYDENKIFFVFQGRIEKYKGLEILAKAYKKVIDKYNNIFLVIAGFGNFEQYHDLYKNLPNCIILNRWLTYEEVAGLFNDKNTICVLPYISATQSGVINVAMPCGTPIIASACGGITEQIQDNVTGWLVTPGDVDALVDKMSYVIEHREKWDFIRQNAYKRMKSLDWNVLAKKIKDLF